MRGNTYACLVLFIPSFVRAALISLRAFPGVHSVSSDVSFCLPLSVPFASFLLSPIFPSFSPFRTALPCSLGFSALSVSLSVFRISPTFAASANQKRALVNVFPWKHWRPFLPLSSCSSFRVPPHLSPSFLHRLPLVSSLWACSWCVFSAVLV